MAGRALHKAEHLEESEEEERDEHGLTRWHYLRGRQIICGTCNCRPCAASCPEQWMPERPEWKAARAGQAFGGDPTAVGRRSTFGEAATEEAQTPNLQDRTPPAERRIPVEGAMAQAMAVVAGEARAEEMAPVYEEA